MKRHKTLAEQMSEQHRYKVALAREEKRNGTYVPQKPPVNTTRRKK